MSFVGNSLQRNRGLRDSTAALSSVLLAAQVLNNSRSDLIRILIVHGGLHIVPTGEISSHRRSLLAQHLRQDQSMQSLISQGFGKTDCGERSVLGQANSAEAAEHFFFGSVCLALE